MGHYKFDIDLPEGEFAERLVKDLLGGERGSIEVKRDWKVTETGNVAIEFECRKRKSGISTTEASWWAIVLDGRLFAHQMIIFIKTSRLKEIAREIYKQKGAVKGGDDRSSRIVLIPLEEFVRYSPQATQPDML